jgi:hypothetical protein
MAMAAATGRNANRYRLHYALLLAPIVLRERCTIPLVQTPL